MKLFEHDDTLFPGTAKSAAPEQDSPFKQDPAQDSFCSVVLKHGSRES